jgi:GcrA cell cycle regulator
MDWNDETMARLRALWIEGHSTAEIGRRLGVSKNAIVGKAHRLNLPPRPSPIRREAGPSVRPRNAQPRRLVGPTLPPFAPGPVAAPSPVAEIAETEARSSYGPEVAESHASPSPVVVASSTPAVAGPRVVPPVRAVAPRPVRLVACCWPLGEPGTKSFRFCDAEAAAGKPYCLAHAQVAYVKVRDRREDAA